MRREGRFRQGRSANKIAGDEAVGGKVSELFAGLRRMLKVDTGFKKLRPGNKQSKKLTAEKQSP